MNRFIIANTPQEIAQALCDKHVVKMPLEEAQMLCTVVRQANPEFADDHDLYRVAHAKHPCTLWAGQTRTNYMFAFRLWNHMCVEYTYRYGRVHETDKKLRVLLDQLPRNIELGSWREPPQCMPDDVKTEKSIDAYHKYYQVYKKDFAKWTDRPIPNFMSE